jgi:hypothetical protein
LLKHLKKEWVKIWIGFDWVGDSPQIEVEVSDARPRKYKMVGMNDQTVLSGSTRPGTTSGGK